MKGDDMSFGHAVHSVSSALTWLEPWVSVTPFVSYRHEMIAVDALTIVHCDKRPSFCFVPGKSCVGSLADWS